MQDRLPDKGLAYERKLLEGLSCICNPLEKNIFGEVELFGNSLCELSYIIILFEVLNVYLKGYTVTITK